MGVSKELANYNWQLEQSLARSQHDFHHRNGKGGVGKSTISQAVAYRLATSGSGKKLSVQLVDTDTTSTTTQWIDRRDQTNTEPKIELVRALRDPAPAVIRASDNHDAVVVDVGARSYGHFADFARIADLWIAPVQVGQGDLDSALQMYSAIKKYDSQHKSGKVPICFVLNRVPTHVSSTEERDAREYIAEVDPTFPLLESAIKDRKVWRDGQKVGRTVYELSGDLSAKAAREFDVVLAEAMKHKSKVGA